MSSKEKFSLIPVTVSTHHTFYVSPVTQISGPVCD